MEIKNAMNAPQEESTEEEEIQYVDEEGNIINPEDIEDEEDEEQIEYVDEEGNVIEVDEETLAAQEAEELEKEQAQDVRCRSRFEKISGCFTGLYYRVPFSRRYHD